MTTTSVIMLLSMCSLWSQNGVSGSSILAFFPAPIPSHHRAYQPLVKGLLERGHKVTYFTPSTINNPPADGSNYTEILIRDYMQMIKQQIAKETGMDEDPIKYFERFWPIPVQQIMMVMMRYFFLEISKEVLRDDKFKGLIDSEAKFDCILYGGTIMQETFSGLSHRFQAPLIEVHPAGNIHYTYWIHGNPYDTSYILDFSVASGDKMTLMERLENTFNSCFLRSIWYLYFLPKYQTLMDKEFRYPGWEKRPSLNELVDKTSMVFSNTHYSLNYPYPLSPNFKEIGGINIIQPKPLPKDLQDFMDSSTNGVIYFTLGSHINATSVLSGISQELIKAFSKVKQNVLWKWNDNYANLPSNIKLGQWFPQQAILSHKNCRLFMSHGGFLSLSESVYFGVPMIGIPVLADQMKNVRHMEINEYGVRLSLRNITEQSVLWAIRQILGDPKYAENAKKRSQLFRDKPETALETAVYWTEYVIRHKGAHHLKPAIATMPWYQQAMIDVYGALLLITMLPLILLYLIIRQILRCVCICCGSSSSNSDKRKRE